MTANPQKPAQKCLFLFTELAGYIVACMKRLAAQGNIEVHVVRWPVNAVAPFQFNLEGENLNFYERKDMSDSQLVEFASNLRPDVIFCSGWIDKGYLKVCREHKHQVRTVLTFDNPWRNTLKQNIASVFGALYVKRYFTDCWVSGAPQHVYARKLGFNGAAIHEGFYSCDYDLFHSYYLANREQKSRQFPRRILFVGRYTELKGVRELWKAFVTFKETSDNNWELWCLGKGELESEFPNHPMIKNFGFVQPSELGRFISDTGVFILPSHYEHWGVVVHEYAAAGFPLICSATTSAATAFLKDGVNGFIHAPESSESLVEVFRKLDALTDEELISMGDKSAALAASITPDTWVQTVHEYLKHKN